MIRNLIVIAGGGLAQVENAVGCLMALSEAGVPVLDAAETEWRGTSAGAIVASVVASGWPPARIATYLSETRTEDFLSRRWFWPLRLLMGGPAYWRDGTANFLYEVLGEHCAYPTVTVILTRAKGMRRVEAPATFDTVMASSAIDGVFGPWRVGDEPMIDGGYTDNVPLDPWHTVSRSHPGDPLQTTPRRVWLILPPRDLNHDRHRRTTIGRLLHGLDVKTSQETDEAERVYSDRDRWPGVTVLRPPPIESSMLALSPERRVMLHAYGWTEARLRELSLASPV